MVRKNSEIPRLSLFNKSQEDKKKIKNSVCRLPETNNRIKLKSIHTKAEKAAAKYNSITQKIKSKHFKKSIEGKSFSECGALDSKPKRLTECSNSLNLSSVTENLDKTSDSIASIENTLHASMNCPGNHGLKSFEIKEDEFFCNKCKSEFNKGTILYECRICNFDLCTNCYMNENAIIQRLANRMEFLNEISSLNNCINKLTCAIRSLQKSIDTQNNNNNSIIPTTTTQKICDLTPTTVKSSDFITISQSGCVSFENDLKETSPSGTPNPITISLDRSESLDEMGSMSSTDVMNQLWKCTACNIWAVQDACSKCRKKATDHVICTICGTELSIKELSTHQNCHKSMAQFSVSHPKENRNYRQHRHQAHHNFYHKSLENDKFILSSEFDEATDTDTMILENTSLDVPLPKQILKNVIDILDDKVDQLTKTN